jgi:hypothetical protein
MRRLGDDVQPDAVLARVAEHVAELLGGVGRAARPVLAAPAPLTPSIA